MAETQLPNLQPQRKASRYRAQRIQAHLDSTNALPLPCAQASPTTPQDPLERSRSRYRRKPSVADTQGQIPEVPAIPQAQLPKQPSQSELSPKSRYRSAAPPSSGASNVRPLRREQSSEHFSSTQPTSNSTRPARPLRREQSSEHFFPLLPTSNSTQSVRPLRREQSSEHFSPPPPKLSRRVDSGTTLESPRSLQSIQHASKSPETPPSLTQSPPPTGELFPPPRPPTPVKLDGPPTSGQIRATRPTEHHDEKSKGFGFGLFKRKHDQNAVKPPGTAGTKSSNEEDEIVPAGDAPVSAVNAGERRVLLECGTYKMMYPVTPTTTPVDLIKSAATTMSNPINVKSAVLLEYFGSVGVHRAIRRYEHIRDVMNSWDHDAQNSLLLIDPGTSSSETELGLSAVPKTKPRDASWTLYFSQSVGKWDKRIVHLKRDGQISVQKDPKKPNDQTNVCHLSDFDIYTPTQEKIKKKIKPPKKNCFAIKSQQKSSMFENTTNFVHFFCVNEKSVADDFHAAVQAWRSWYLVNVMGAGIFTQTADPSGRKAGISSPAVQSPLEIDSVESHYQLGTFSSLLDMDHFNNKRLSSYMVAPSAVKAPSKQRIPDIPRRSQLAEDEPLALLKTADVDNNRVARSQTQRRQPSTELRRTGTTPAKTHRPLISLAAVDRLPPRSSREFHSDRGHALIDKATSPITQEHDRQNSQQVSATAMQSINPRQSLQSTRDSVDLEPFTGEGLLAQSQGGWGNSNRGRGVLDGAHAKGPMVEISGHDRFTQGSLLRSVERQQGAKGPVIDRAKTVEKDVKTGERL
ncbi:hypothetical protein AMS68_007150 [Peltaster fructicola]|uniref:PH domain-containing protein n=1 Tax=Peltaster fructicola TaxID=286661 RepID=A0A6H0Y3Q8_9PEZI|nr:hypothetical protein AMS68_007150 [Peltaster fructicola]